MAVMSGKDDDHTTPRMMAMTGKLAEKLLAYDAKWLILRGKARTARKIKIVETLARVNTDQVFFRSGIAEFPPHGLGSSLLY